MSEFNVAGQNRTSADWALQWLWNQPAVSLVLSGMSAMDQVVQNLAAADLSGAGQFGATELELFDRVREKIKSRAVIPCTGCNYCMPCPNGVAIPDIFHLYNEGLMYGKTDSSIKEYRTSFPKKSRADQCVPVSDLRRKVPAKHRNQRMDAQSA